MHPGHALNPVWLDLDLFASLSSAMIALQVGCTPEGVEMPKCVKDSSLQQSIAAQPDKHRATLPQGPDCKWRFMWRLGQRPPQTAYAELNSPPIVPKGPPQLPSMCMQP